MAFYGVDLSQWQGDINFAQLAKKIDFAIIRTVSGKYYDKRAKEYINECYKHNIPFGLYCAAYPLIAIDAENEALKIIEYARICKPTYPIFYDYEGFSRDYARKNGYKHTDADVRYFTEIFCNTLKERGFYPGIYANWNYAKNVYGLEMFNKYGSWLAYWGTKKPYKAHMWQFSNNGHLPGINGRVDKDVCYVNFPEYIKENHFNGW